MRQPVLIAAVFLMLALSAFALGNERHVDAVAGYDTRASAGPNVVREIIFPDSRVSSSYRIANILGFVFMVASLTVLAADRHNRKREYF